MIEKITSIQGLGLYDGKNSFPPDILFKKNTIIYGYNGSGKTSLSRALRYLETKQIPDCLKDENPQISISLVVDGKNQDISQPNIANLDLPIRVFNTDYVWENIKWSKNGTNGIVTVTKGQGDLVNALTEAVERQKNLKIEINGGIVEQKKIDGAESSFKKAEKSFEDLLTECARNIKNSGWCNDINYKSPKFSPIIEAVCKEEVAELSDDDIERYIKQAKETQKLDTLDDFNFSISLDSFISQLNDIVTILEKPASRKVIVGLKESFSLEKWVQDGYRNHLHQDKECPACGNMLTKDRWEELQGHFSTEAEELDKKVDDALKWWKELNEGLNPPPIKEKIYEAYYNQTDWDLYISQKQTIEIFAQKIIEVLNEKKASIETSISLPISKQDCEKGFTTFLSAIALLDNHIKGHNTFHLEQKTLKDAAELALIRNFAVQNKVKYLELLADKAQKNKELVELKQEYDALPEKIASLKQKTSEVGRACELINKCLEDYLGHKRFQLVPEDGAYSVTRNGKKSSAPLSEGEKTALAFCHFIVSLHEDTDCKLNETIVVIDDPISSLDNRHLHYAFNFMRNKLVSAKQLILLTHSFVFFKEGQKAYWSRFDDKKKETTSLLNLALKNADSGFYSALYEIPNALKDHESEYHYFASKLFDANKNDWQSADLYGLVNACRRVLESFLYFKIPVQDGLRNKLDNLIKELEKDKTNDNSPPSNITAQARARFCDTGSHGDNLDKFLGFDNITVDTVKDAVKFTLEFIECADKIHFSSLNKASK